MVERYIRDVEVARSNRVTPIITNHEGILMDISNENLERCKKVVGNLFLKRKGIYRLKSILQTHLNLNIDNEVNHGRNR